MIGIRLADGNFFSICGDGPEKKRVVLSPANKGQKRAKIDLFHFSDSSFFDVYHIGSLFLDNVDSEIELSVDTNGKKVIAEALSPSTGARDSFVALLAKPLEAVAAPIARAPGAIAVKGIRSIQVMVGLVLAILSFLTFFLLYTMIPYKTPSKVAAESPVPELASQPVPRPAPKLIPVPEVVPVQVFKPQKYIRYRVKYGDTLWSIADDFCGNPYMYGRIAEENHLESPKRLIPGTVIIIPVDEH